METTEALARVTEQAGKVSLYKKLLAVYKAVRYIQKDGNNSFHKYKYVTEAAIKERMHEAFMDQGILFNLSVTDMTEVVDGKNRLATIKLYYKFIDAETGAELEGTSYGTGVDSLDKGLYKAIAGGIKYILTSNFLIATGDDPEDDTYEKEQAEKEAKAAAAAKKNGAGKSNGKVNAPPPQEAPAAASGSSADPTGGETLCEVCNSPITDYTTSKGKLFPADALIAESQKKYGMPLCAVCQINKGKEAHQGAGARVN